MRFTKLLFLFFGILPLFLLPALASADANPRLIGSSLFDIVSVKVSQSQEVVWFSANWLGSSPAIVRYDDTSGQVQNLVTDGNTDPGFALSSDEQYIVYGVSNSSGTRGSLYRLPSGGGDPVLLVAQSQLAGYPNLHGITSDNQNVIFVDERPGNERVYAVPLMGGALVELTAGLPTGELWKFSMNATGTHVALLYETADDTYLILADVADGSHIILNPDGTNIGDYVINFSPDGESLFFQRGSLLLRANVADGVITQIGEPGASLENLIYSPDGQYLFYDWRNTGDVDQVYRLTLSDNTLIPISNFTFGYVSYITPATDERVLFLHRSTADYNQPATLYSVAYEPLTDPIALATTSPIAPVAISSDGETAVYNTRLSGQRSSPIYAVQTDGSSAPIAIYPETDGRNFRIAPSDDRVYIATYPQNSYELYVVPITGGTATSYFERNEAGMVGLMGFLSADRLLMVDSSSTSHHYNALYLLDPNLPAITPTPTFTRTPTPTRTPTFTYTPIPTGTPTHTPTTTFTPSATATATHTLTHTATASATATIPTLTPSVTATGSLPPTLTATGTATSTVTPSSTATATITASSTAMATRTPSATATFSPTATVVSTMTPTATPVSTTTPTATSVSSATPTATIKVTITPTQPTSTPSSTPSPNPETYKFYLPLLSR